MPKPTLLAATAVLALGAPAAYAGFDGAYSHKGYGHAGYEHNQAPYQYAGRYNHKPGPYGACGYRYCPNWFSYRRRPNCRVEPRTVSIKV